MKCNSVRLPSGDVAIVCTRGRRAKKCQWCVMTAAFQCDWKVHSGTCDKHVCGGHALEVGKDKHLCPEHQTAYKKWQEQHATPA